MRERARRNYLKTQPRPGRDFNTRGRFRRPPPPDLVIILYFEDVTLRELAKSREPADRTAERVGRRGV